MATLNPSSSFQSWQLTPEEELQGAILSNLQKQCIQNQLCSLAEEKLALTFDPDHLHKSLQQEAELQGKILALKYLIILSVEMETVILNNAKTQQS